MSDHHRIAEREMEDSRKEVEKVCVCVGGGGGERGKEKPKDRILAGNDLTFLYSETE